jgi:hypothetical protein
MRSLLIGLAGALAVVGASLGLLHAALPRPTADDRVGVRVLRVLETTRGGGAVVRLAGRTVRTSCERVSRRRSRIEISDGTTLLVDRTRVTLQSSSARGRQLAARHPELPVAAADLAGNYLLYRAQLTASVVRGRDVVNGTTTVLGRPAYRIRLGRPTPQVELLVDRETYRPLAATYRSQRLQGFARLLQAGGAGGC